MQTMPCRSAGLCGIILAQNTLAALYHSKTPHTYKAFVAGYAVRLATHAMTALAMASRPDRVCPP